MQRALRRLLTERLEQRMLLTTVTSADPAANSFGAPLASDVSATFNQDVTAASDQTFVVHTSQRGRLTGAATTVSFTGQTVRHDPANDFFPGETVQVTVTSGVTTAGGAAVPRSWKFHMEAAGGSGEFVESGQGIGTPNVASYGVEMGDLDGDGDLDAFVVNNGVGDRVYLNDGIGTFADSGQSLGNSNGREVAFGDLDGDGDLDAVVVNVSGQGDQVWQNNGNGSFAALQTLGATTTQGVQLADLDSDGDLDAFMVHSGAGDRVWRNNNGMLSDSGQNLGNHAGQSVQLGDLDNDGDLDAFVANSNYQPNRIWLNDGSGAFTDSGQTLGFHGSVTVDLGDIDSDGDLDAFVGNADQHNRVYMNSGTGEFTDSGQLLAIDKPGQPCSLGCRYTRTQWIEFGDIDGDGDLDVFGIQANGGPDRVYLNDGNGIFTDTGQDLLLPGNAHGMALGDVDGDGDLDAFVVNDLNPNPDNSVSRVWINRNLTPSVTLSVDDAAIAESAGTATVTATLSAPFGQPVTVDLGFAGTATATVDYTTSGTQIVVAAGSTSGSVTISAVQDVVDEPDETVVVDITSITNGQEAGTQRVTLTILDDDEPLPTVSLAVDNPTIPEAAGVATFTATLSAAAALPVTVELGISGSATPTADYNASGTQIVIAAGSTSGSVTVTAVQDTADEPDESVVVDITSVTGGNESGTQQATTTIVDDDEPVMPDVSLAVDNGAIDEDGGSATFTATLSEATTAAVAVNLALSGTATAGSDYNPSGTQIVIAPGATSGSITVTAVDDDEDEADESVVVDVDTVNGGNEAGTQQATTTITDDDAPPGFTVTSLTATASGFVAGLSTDLNPDALNLYDTQNLAMGDADVTLVGAASGPVRGSLVVDASLRSVTFIKSGAPLAADSYTVTLRSGSDGFQDAGGQLLDGNDDGIGGDDYTSSFDVAAPAAGTITVSIPDFTRGPGQTVNLPADTTDGIPITISDGENVRAIDIRVSYDPTKLTITGATAGADAPAGASVVSNTNTPGLAILVLFSSTAFSAGSANVINLQAEAPTENAGDIYGSSQVLDLHSITISDGNDNEAPVLADDAVQSSIYFADVSGNGRINASDAAQVARFAALIDGGFAGSLNVDPIVLGDISGNGRINAADASRVAQFAALIDVPEIPPIPAGIVTSGVVHLGPGLPDLGFAARKVAPATSQGTGVKDAPLLPQVRLDPYQAVDTVMASMVVLDEDERLILALEDAMAELLSAELLAD